MRPLPGVPREPDGPLGAFLDAYPHAFTRAELLSTWSRHHLDFTLADAPQSRILSGVYASPQHLRRPQVMAEAATLWAPRALVTGSLALHLYNKSLPSPGYVDLATTNGDNLHPPHWVRVHQTGRPPEYGTPCGVPCTLPARALLDAWRYGKAFERPNIFWNALWIRACTSRQLSTEMMRWPRIAGRRDLDRMLAWFTEGATSALEVRAKHETFVGTRFKDFEWQAEIPLVRRKVRVDMLHRKAQLVIELDGDAYHSTRTDREADRDRQNALVASGFTVLRFGWHDIVDHPQWCRDQVNNAILHRLSRARSQ